MSDVMGFLGISNFPAPNISAGNVPAGRPPERPVNLIRYLQQAFTRVGMPAGMANWAMDLLKLGASNTEFQMRLYEHPVFQNRFKPIFDRQRAGLPVPTPEEILAWERQAEALMANAGFPPQFYDSYEDFQPMITRGWTVAQLADRVNDSFVQIASLPGTVRQAFGNFFGPAANPALAAVVLDPEKALPALRTQIAAAETAGAGMQFGFTLGRRRALQAGEAGFRFEDAISRFGNLATQRDLFRETMSERRDDLQAEEEGVAALFGLEGAGEALTSIERRRQERQAEFSGGGGAAGSSSGLRGLGTAR